MNGNNTWFEQIQQTWDQQNSLFRTIPFVTEEEVHRLAESSSVSLFCRQRRACLLRLAHSVANSTLLTLCLPAVSGTDFFLPPALLFLLWGFSLLLLLLQSVRLLLLIITYSPRAGLSWAGMSARLLRLFRERDLFVTIPYCRHLFAYRPSLSRISVCISFMTLLVGSTGRFTESGQLPPLLVAERQPVKDLAAKDTLLAVSISDRKPQAASDAIRHSDPSVPGPVNPQPQPGTQPENIPDITPAEETAHLTVSSLVEHSSAQVICNCGSCAVQKYCTMLYEDIFNI